jgi:hypothetical protein
MRVTARGWSRDMGERAFLSADLALEPVTEDHLSKLSRDKTFFKLNRQVLEGERGRRLVVYTVQVLAHADLNLNGSYLVQLELDRSDIDRLFYLINGDRSLPKLLEMFSAFKAVEDVGLPREQMAEPIVEQGPKELMPCQIAEEPKAPLLFFKKVRSLELSVRSKNCLDNDNLVYVGDLVQKTEAEMFRIPSLGRRSLNEIKEVLDGMGLHLGMDVPYWPPENVEEMSERFEGMSERLENERRELASKQRALTFFGPEES